MKAIKQSHMVKMLIEANGYSVISFAEKIGISTRTLQRWLKEEPLSDELVAIVQNEFDVDLKNVAITPTVDSENARLAAELAAALLREKELKAQVYDLLKEKGWIPPP